MEHTASPIQLHAKLTRHMSAMSAMLAPAKSGELPFNTGYFLLCVLPSRLPNLHLVLGCVCWKYHICHVYVSTPQPLYNTVVGIQSRNGVT